MIRVTCFLKNKKSRKKVHFGITDCNFVGKILLMHATLSFYLVKITTYSYRNGRIHFFSCSLGNTRDFSRVWYLSGGTSNSGRLVAVSCAQL